MYPHGGIPFKLASDNHGIALKHYDNAHDNEKVAGPPAALATVEMTSAWALHHFLTGDIVACPEYESVYFTRVLNKSNYPGAHIAAVQVHGASHRTYGVSMKDPEAGSP